MPAKLDRCVEEVKAQLKKDHPDWDDDKIEQTAWAICVKSTGISPRPREGDDSLSMEEVNCHQAAGGKKSSYALTKGDNVSDWALPYKNADGSINPTCLRNALARWNQVKGYSDAEKRAALKKLIRAADKVGISVSDKLRKLAGLSSEMSAPEMVWSSQIVVHESFESAVNALRRPGLKALYGLEEAKLDEAAASVVDGVASNDTHFYIVGDAIHATTTANLHTYLAEELELAAETLAGKPVMVDHARGSMDNAGKVLVAAWESRAGGDGAITYVARIRKSHPVAEAVAVGDIDTVSIGATAEKVECSICGEDMRTCPHHIGRVYEVDGREMVATAIGRGLTFRELSITPFPADARASARVAHKSMFSALEALVESCEYKPDIDDEMIEHVKTQKETRNMSEDDRELALARQLRELQAQIEQLQKEKEAADQEIERFREKEKAGLVDRVFELEVLANLKESKDEAVRKTELSALTVDALNARLDTLRSVVATMEKIAPKGKAVVVDTPPPADAEEKADKRDPLLYTREEIKAGLRQALGGMRTSESARMAVRRWNLDPSNPHSSAYRAIVARNIAKIRGGGE